MNLKSLGEINSTKERDNIKNEYCKNNNIKLIRISYWELYSKKYKNTLIKNIPM